MRNLLLVSIIFSLILLECKKENITLDVGKITGFDPRDCACCGGWFIEIKDSTYRFNELPANSSLDLSDAVYPIYVEIKWAKIENPCLGDEIVIKYIRKK